MRLLTRLDFDGLACAALLRELGMIDSCKYVHPKDVQDGKVDVTENDIMANIPYAEGCHMWFDHHSSEQERLGFTFKFEGASYPSPSAARVVYDYFNGAEKLSHFNEMIAAVDRVDSGRLTADEILDPEGWILLGFIMDPRTGLARVRDFRIGNYEFMEELIEVCRIKKIDEILKIPDVMERVETYRLQNEQYKDMILQYSHLQWDMIVTDLRGVDPIYTGNRFLQYCLFPDQNISIWMVDGHKKQKCVFSVGYSIINRTATVDVGSLMLKYGGGGHRQVGTCQVPNEDADRVLSELKDAIYATSESAQAENSFSVDDLDAFMQDLGLEIDLDLES